MDTSIQFLPEFLHDRGWFELSKNPVLAYPADKWIRTCLPRQITVIRVIALSIFLTLAALNLAGTVFFWPVVVVGIAIIAWTLETHLRRKDPLVDAFYRICDGKDKFEKLKQIEVDHQKKISDMVTELKWDDLPAPISRGLTADGRNIIFVKAKSQDPKDQSDRKDIMVFVERMAYDDFSDNHRPHGRDARSLSLAHALFFVKQNDLGELGRVIQEEKNSEEPFSTRWIMKTDLYAESANDFFQQMQTVTSDDLDDGMF